LCHVSVSSVKRSRHRFASSRWHPVLTPGARERHETPTLLRRHILTPAAEPGQLRLITGAVLALIDGEEPERVHPAY
jgi:hypothetical protein